MRVSVVVCTFNRSKSLVETLECLRFQSYRDFEVSKLRFKFRWDRIGNFVK